jgi:hypothetical protein
MKIHLSLGGVFVVAPIVACVVFWRFNALNKMTLATTKAAPLIMNSVDSGRRLGPRNAAEAPSKTDISNMAMNSVLFFIVFQPLPSVIA